MTVVQTSFGRGRRRSRLSADQQRKALSALIESPRTSVPTFGRSKSGKWHVTGPDGCQYGQVFADASDTTPDETATATDIVAYQPPESHEIERSSTAPDSIAGGSFPHRRTDTQRLVLPGALRESEADLCTSCRLHLDTQQKRRARLITELKLVTPIRDVEWAVIEHADHVHACDWCRAHELSLWYHDRLDSHVCPACGRLFNTPLGDPGPDATPESDRRPDTPTALVTPIVVGASLPDYDPTTLSGSNRPVITVHEKDKYASVTLDLTRTGHGFTAAGIAALEEIRAQYADQVAADEAHQIDVTLTVETTPRSVDLEGLYPADCTSVLTDCWDIVSDPETWFAIGWPQQGYIHPHSSDRSIPGSKPVVEAFPRLRTRTPAQSVDTQTIRSVTDPGRYERGERYYNRGAVTEIERVDELVQATVQGSRPYTVRVTLGDGSYLKGQCSCPDDTVPCKHIVAAVLASGDITATGRNHSLTDLLNAASADELRTLLQSAADDDISLRQRIYDKLGN